MDTHNLTKVIDELVEETGYARSTICGRACNDPLLYDRLIKRKEKDKSRLAKLESYRRGLATDKNREAIE